MHFNQTELALIAVAAICIGSVICFFGKKVFKVFLFLAAFAATAGLTYYVELSIEKKNPSIHLDRWITLLVPSVLGVLGGCLVLSLIKLGLFLAGACGGVMFSFIIFALVGNDFGAHAVVIRLVILGVLALLCGIALVAMEEKLIILVSAFGGAFAVFAGADHWVKSGLAAALEGLLDEDLPQKSTKLYIMVGGTFALAIFGLIVQTIHHKKSKPKAGWESQHLLSDSGVNY